MLAARIAHAVSLAIVLVASLSACSASTYVDESHAVAPLETPGTDIDQKADAAGRPGQQDAVSVRLPVTSRHGGLRGPSARSGASPGAPSPPQVVETDIAALVPDDTAIVMEKRGDLDGDGDQDVLLVLQKKTQAESAPRGLMILRSKADGSFEKVVENPNAIPCQSCGGMMGDPLSGIEVRTGGFVLTFEGGSRELWSHTYSFAYSETEDDWHLERIDRKVLDRIDGQHEDSHATREQIGAISIRDFDAALMVHDADT